MNLGRDVLFMFEVLYVIESKVGDVTVTVINTCDSIFNTYNTLVIVDFRSSFSLRPKSLFYQSHVQTDHPGAQLVLAPKTLMINQ